jgi:hypothetical protein
MRKGWRSWKKSAAGGNHGRRTERTPVNPAVRSAGREPAKGGKLHPKLTGPIFTERFLHTLAWKI